MKSAKIKEINKAQQSQEKGLIKIENETKHNFIIVYDTIYKNNSLSANEMQLIIKLLACAPTFEPTITKLASILKQDRATIYRTAKKLQDKGYLSIKKYGNKSIWTINQEPILKIKDFSNENLLQLLLNNQINEQQLFSLWKAKYIDDNQWITIRDAYTREIIRLAKTPWLND